MRFYYIIFTLFLEALFLITLPAYAVELSSDQKVLLQSQGAAGISSIIEESEISFTSTSDVENFVSEIISAQLSESSSIDDIAQLTTQTMIVVFNANIYTANEGSNKATALAVKDGKFIYVGDDSINSKYSS